MKVVTIAAIVTCFAVLGGCISQEVVPKTDRMYRKIVTVSATNQELYTKTLEWIARSFGSSDAVIQFKDPEQGKIIGKGIVSVTYTIAPVDTFFTLTIEFKDNRARFTFDNLYTKTDSPLLPSKMALQNRGQMERFSIRAFVLIEDWKNYVSNNTGNW